MRARVSLALALGTVCAVARAQCPPGEIDTAAINSRIIDRALLVESATAPRVAPEASQASAPSGTGDSTSLVDQPAFTSLLSFAIDNGLVSSDQNALTVSLSPFAFVAAARPEVIDRQSLYEKYQLARRFGGAVTLGGKGEAFDRDGDGTADDALEADELGDIVTWELRWRFHGTRDRRDPANFERFREATNSAFGTFFASQGDLAAAVLGAVASTAAGCFSETQVEAFLETDEFSDRLAEHSGALAAVKAAYGDSLKAIDEGVIWTLVAGGTSRGEQFGPDKQMIGIRGAYGGAGRNWSFNVDYTRTEGLAGLEDPRVLRGGLEYQVLWLKDSLISRQGITVSWSGVYESFSHVPEAKHDTNAKLGMKFELPLKEGMGIPVSVSWANHKDLLTDEAELRGHVGFTVDLSKLLALGKAGGVH